MSGPLSRRGAACIFNPYHPAEGAEGLGNGITYSIYPPLDTCPSFPTSLKWGAYYYVPLNKYPFFSWWKGDNPESNQTDGAWFPQGSGNRVSKKKGGGPLSISFGLRTKEVKGYTWGGFAEFPTFGIWTPRITGGTPGQVFPYGNFAPYAALGSHVTFNGSFGYYPPNNPPFPSGTEFKANNSSVETYKIGPDYDNPDLEFWGEFTENINVDGSFSKEYNQVTYNSGFDPTTLGFAEWYTDNNGVKHYWKETGIAINSEYFQPKRLSEYNYDIQPIIAVRDAQADDYPAFNISSTAATVEPDYGILYDTATGQLQALYTSRYMCWNTPVSDYSFRRDLKTMKFELVAFLDNSGCDTGCSYAGKKYKFKFKYQEGDMTIGLNGSPSFSGSPIECLKSDITWGAYTEEDIEVTLEADQWVTTHPEQVLWSTDWNEDVLARGKARRLIDIYLVSIEDA